MNSIKRSSLKFFWIATSMSFVLAISATVFASDENDLEIGIVEHLDENIDPEIMLINESGTTSKLGDLIDKPTVISLVYYRCPGICTPLMDGIADVIDKVDLIPGKDYQVLTISFDPRENIDLGRKKKANYLATVEKKDEVKGNWRFFVSDSANITKLTENLGFRYKQQGNDFLHTGTLVFVSADGKITRYLNGTSFLPFEFKMALIETSKGKSGPTINKILQYCYSYDPKGQAYTLNITRVAGGIIMFFALVLFLVLVIRPMFKRKHSTT